MGQMEDPKKSAVGSTTAPWKVSSNNLSPNITRSQIHSWWKDLSTDEQSYFNGFEDLTKPRISLLESIEIFADDLKPVLGEKLNSLTALESGYQELIKNKIEFLDNNFKLKDPFASWFLTRAFTISPALELAEIKKEKKRIRQALLLITNRPSEHWNKQTEKAKLFPIESIYTGKLKRSSKYRLSGLCPFHTEKTPSFTIYLKDNSWWCFGCNTGGDSLNFIQKLENLDFASAVRRLS
jgi:hypothetical protein